MAVLRPMAWPRVAAWCLLALLLLGVPLRAAEAPPDREARVEVAEPSARAMQYYRTGNWLWVATRLWALAVPTLLLASGLSARMRDVAWKFGRRWFFVVGLYAVLYLAVTAVVNLPLEYYASYARPHAYGLSNQDLGRWFKHEMIGLGIAMTTGFLLLWIPYRLIAASPKRWWLYLSALSVPFSLFTALIVPIWIDPLFNDFGRMRDRTLEARILDLARRAGVEEDRVYEVDKSRDTEAVNAYVTGLLGTKRIVLWDTTLAKLEPDEVLAVMGHELGHFVLHHVVAGLLVSCALTTIGLYFVHWASGRVLARWGGRLGVQGLSDVASVPLLIILIDLYMLVAMPVGNAFSRAIEHEADRFALELTQDNHAAASAFATLQSENLGNPRPGPFYTIWRGSHPSLGERIEFCNDYHPWRDGQPLRYGHRFRDGP